MPTGGSDRTLKKDIKPISNSLSTVMNLKPVSWKWKSDNKMKHGFIAQDVEKVIPYLVSEDKWEDGTMRKFLASDGIVPYLVAAIQEQQRQIIELREQLKDARSK